MTNVHNMFHICPNTKHKSTYPKILSSGARLRNEKVLGTIPSRQSLVFLTLMTNIPFLHNVEWYVEHTRHTLNKNIQVYFVNKKKRICKKNQICFYVKERIRFLLKSIIFVLWIKKNWICKENHICFYVKEISFKKKKTFWKRIHIHGINLLYMHHILKKRQDFNLTFNSFF